MALGRFRGRGRRRSEKPGPGWIQHAAVGGHGGTGLEDADEQAEGPTSPSGVRARPGATPPGLSFFRVNSSRGIVTRQARRRIHDPECPGKHPSGKGDLGESARFLFVIPRAFACLAVLPSSFSLIAFQKLSYAPTLATAAPAELTRQTTRPPAYFPRGLLPQRPGVGRPGS